MPPPAGQTRSKTFSGGATWDEVIHLYSFDRRLRMLVMEAIEQLEVAVRASWANQLSLQDGSHAYLKPECFTDPFEHALFVSKAVNAAKKSSEIFISHYLKKYKNPYAPPVWAICEMLTIGQLSQLYASTASLKVKDAVSKDIGLPSKEVIQNVLQVVSYTRNICAHHNRLWNRKSVKRLTVIKKYRSEMIRDPNDASQMDNRIYNILVLLVNVLRLQGDVSDWHRGLITLLDSATDSQRDVMGFPRSWKTLACWQP